jgi:hypothetical protein
MSCGRIPHGEGFARDCLLVRRIYSHQVAAQFEVGFLIPPSRLKPTQFPRFPQVAFTRRLARLTRRVSTSFASVKQNGKHGVIMSVELDSVASAFANLQIATGNLKDNKTKMAVGSAIDALLMAIGAIELRLNVLEMKERAQGGWRAESHRIDG